MSDLEFAWRPGERAALPAALTAHTRDLARLVIALDGPGGSGKSTTAREVARRLGLLFVDTGAMYRALALAAIRTGVDPSDAAALASLVRQHRIELEPRGDGVTVRWDGEDVSKEVRGPEVTSAVSQVAAHPDVRREMVARQRQMGAKGGVILDGRDIGTVVYPQAPLKVFLTAEPAARARRRQQDDATRGVHRPLQEIESDLARRDALDSERATSPLRRAPDAILLDTTDLDLEEQIDAVLTLAVRVVEGRPAAPVPRVVLEPVEPEDWRQPGYRTFPSLLYRLVHHTLWVGLQGIFGLRIRRHPLARLPGSVLVASNHIAGFDPVVSGTAVPFECWFVAKLELFRNPLLARLISRFNAIPIRRGTADYETLDRAVELLRQGRNVLMFPEGTRQKPGKLGDARWGFGYVAAQSGRPIVPVFVRGTREGRPRFFRRAPMEATVGEAVRARIAPGTDPHALYKELGARTMERIEALMLRSAAEEPLPGLELPGRYAASARPAERTEVSTRS